jgi:hypothetical protein
MPERHMLPFLWKASTGDILNHEHKIGCEAKSFEGSKRCPLSLPCDRTLLKKQGFVSQDPIGAFSIKQECTSTHISIQYHDI